MSQNWLYPGLPSTKEPSTFLLLKNKKYKKTLNHIQGFFLAKSRKEPNQRC